MFRCCRELQIQTCAEVAIVTNEQLSLVTWMNAQQRQRFRLLQNDYGTVPGVITRVSSAAVNDK
jgi:hypothetical protein